MAEELSTKRKTRAATLRESKRRKVITPTPPVSTLPATSSSTSEMELETTSQHANDNMVMKSAIPSKSTSRKKSSNNKEQVQGKRKTAVPSKSTSSKKSSDSSAREDGREQVQHERGKLQTLPQERVTQAFLVP